ncbi:MAG: tetratricopeptide repeat protein [Cytophagaceae bacterium]|nr:tetratricopeptide repeat protein [Cytophagaceae bacterium]
MFRKNFFIAFLFCFLSGLAFSQSDEIRIANEYYNNGEFEKAKVTFEKLAKKEENLLLIYTNYLNTLLALKEKENAEKFSKRMMKAFPDDVLYPIDHYLINVEILGEEKAQKEFQSFVNSIKNFPDRVNKSGSLFIKRNRLKEARELFLTARKAEGDKTSYAIGLANVYDLTGETEKMIEELLGYLEAVPGAIESVKNTFQNNLTEKAEYDLLETTLYAKIQKNPDQIIFNELLLWLNIQHKNFSKALIQAKAIDKRNKMQGGKVIEVGKIAMENKDYENASKYFQYVVDEFKNGINYSLARRLLINSKEEQVKNTFPVDMNRINSLINDYKSLVNDLGKNSNTLEAMRSMALLFAFYKNDRDTAIVILNDVIAQSRYDLKLRDKAKIDLGDIYLLKEEPWESTLLYSQVEKDEKDEPLGHEAKLRNAKLAYYKGEFELAQGHLDVLKLATSREIANDAMDLSILIQDNIALDTSADAMKEYAAIDLLLFQNKTAEALQRCDEMLKKYPGHSLTDEIYWLKAKLYKKIGDYETAVLMLQKIGDMYARDILGDDALYLKALIYEENLKDTEKAKALYQDLLKKYPGSIFGADARKRFRLLRGDAIVK